MAGKGRPGRFDARYERANVFAGMRDDLQEHWGQRVQWYRFDPTDTVPDPIYDVGDQLGDGRAWLPPFPMPCLTVVRTEGAKQVTEGLYIVDSVHLTLSLDQARKAGLPTLESSPLDYYNDRFVYMGLVFEVAKVEIQGLVGARYTVAGIDAVRVMADELVNDPNFQSYTDPGVLRARDAPEPS